MTSLLIKDAFDTARLVAFFRALEHERPGAHFHDPHARSLAGARGEEIMQKLPQEGSNRWAVVMRTCIYDEIILRTVEQEEVDAVINLGAGLDTRPYRLPLPASLRWIEVDYPDVLAYKEEMLASAQPVCVLRREPLNVADDEARSALLAKVSAEAKHILVMTEGLLIYLTVQQVAAIAADLYAQESVRWWLTEFVSPLALEKDEWNAFASESARTRFAPPGGLSFFRLHGWKVAEFRFPVREAVRLQIPLQRKWLMRLLALLLPKQPDESYNQGGFVLFKRG